jgi:hypothetical protein
MHFDPDLVIIFTGVVAIVFIASYFGQQKRRDRMALIEKMLDKGQPLSPALLASLGTNGKHPQNSIGHAAFLMLLGVALAVFFGAMTGGYGVPNFLWAIGLFPFAIGLAQLIGILFDKNRNKDKNTTDNQNP